MISGCSLFPWRTSMPFYAQISLCSFVAVIGVLLINTAFKEVRAGEYCHQVLPGKRPFYLDHDYPKGSLIDDPPHAWTTKNFSCDLVYIKIPKCGSTTVAGIARHVGHSRGLQGIMTDFRQEQGALQGCRVFSDHEHLSELPIKNDINTALVFSFLREPRSRMLSSIKEKKGRHNVTIIATEKQLHLCLKADGEGRQQQKFLKNALTIESNMMSLYVDIVHRLTLSVQNKSFNRHRPIHFIGLLERLNESLVALAMLANLNLTDVLYLNALKVSSEDPRKTLEPHTIERAQKITNSDEFRDINQLDFRLYEWANQSLQLTIDSLQPQFSKTLAQFEHMLSVVQTACPPRHYSAKEKRKHCYFQNMGCGYPCLLETVRRNGWKPL
eukprot:m.60021 g.60021  ORF g.60021 m.60021 type:complete len:384 (+) comp11288_c0_seq2:367-1518(+)